MSEDPTPHLGHAASYQNYGGPILAKMPDIHFAVGKRAVLKMRQKNGRYEITCPKNFWSVSGPDPVAVFSDALHYWRQYAADGEYDEPEPPK